MPSISTNFAPISAPLTSATALPLMLDVEQAERANARYAQRLRWAKLGQSASLEDLGSAHPARH
ncbi:MAG: hypothetical protein IPP82_14380 [Xanthomonadales bacterium]|nr:hypothetical protein [Xanthomonadales bacterium]